MVCSRRFGLPRLALEKPDGLYWVWIGQHDDYDKLI